MLWTGAAVAALVAIVSAVSAAGAAPKRPGAGAQPAAVKRSHTITLVTGDRVFLNVMTDGRQSVTVDNPAGRTRRASAFRSFHSFVKDGDLYAYPVEVGPYVGRLLDPELFNLTQLVAQGYSDKASASIPVIATYRAGPAPSSLPGGITRTRTLQSIRAVAGREAKAQAVGFGRALRQQLKADAPTLWKHKAGRLARTGPFARIKTIYLDRKVKASLADSVPQIGAPQAWAAGFDGTGIDVAVLDTGIDATHPDLAGKVTAEANFTPDPSPADGFGHGTHVASIVAGGGQASGGLRKGVAPGARLMNGKVLNNFGSGLESWIIDGMEWAAANGAEVISMSLAGGPTDGTDPMAQAVDRITDTNGVLFTIAAGNIGFFGEGSVTTPGTASKALTVGAVDKSNVLAFFSGLGPRLGDFAVKPDITAPGVDIIAARAAGTSLGTPIDAFYTMLSGTSMATPHSAGAAAILKQEFPLATPLELKSALVSTALPGPYSVYQQGGGRVDVARAFSQKVYAAPAPVDFGYFPWPHDTPRQLTKTITYSNHSAAAVSLALTVEVTAKDGTPSAPGQVTTSAPSVSVPAGGTATVDVTVDEALGTPSLYGGFIAARSADGNVVVRTPVGFYKEPERYNLTIDGIARDGRPARGISWVDVVNADDTTRFIGRADLFNGPVTFRVPPGTYSAMGFLFTYDEPQVFALETGIAGDPQFEVTHDMSLTVDARPATEVQAVTPERPTEPNVISLTNYRAGEERGSFTSSLLTGFPIDQVFAATTEQVTVGDYEFYSKWNLRAPELDISVVSPQQIKLDAAYAFGGPKIDGRLRLPLEFVGLGREEDYVGRDVRGKAVLIARGEIFFATKVANAARAGAVLAIIHNNRPGLLLIGLSGAEIPAMSLYQDQGLQLQQLIAQGPVTIEVRGILQSPYIYDVLFPEPGGIDSTNRHVVDRSNTVNVAAKWHGHVSSWLAGDAHHAFRPYSFFSFESVRNFTTPFSRTEYYSLGDTRWLHQAWQSMTNEQIFEGFLQEPLVTYTRRDNLSDNWFKQPQRPGVIRSYGVGGEGGEPVVRDGNTLIGFVPPFVDDEGRWGSFDSRTDGGRFRLYESGTLIAEGTQFFGGFPVSGAPSTYRAELDVSRAAPFWRFSSETHTTWTFNSSQPAAGVVQPQPLLLVDYDLGRLDLLNRAHGDEKEVHLRVHRQQGAPAARITSVLAWASFDDGATWTQVPVSSEGGGHYVAEVTHPATAQDVSLRVQAADAGGSSISQTVVRAYGLD
jgi:subtilisin family serine protease